MYLKLVELLVVGGWVLGRAWRAMCKYKIYKVGARRTYIINTVCQYNRHLLLYNKAGKRVNIVTPV
jgi:hypothetical protein